MKKYKDKISILFNRLFYSEEEFKSDNFDALADLLIYTIRQQDDTIEMTICQYMYKVFSDWRRRFPGEPYKIEYYDMLYKAMREIAMQKNNRLKLTEDRVSGLNWLFGEYTDIPVNEETYSWLWILLLLPIEYKNDNLLLNYWGDAYQYFTYSLRKIYPEYSVSSGVVTNQNDIERRDTERERFLEFNYALGGLLMYKQRYVCIRRIFDFTMSEPPDYVLLPKSMNDIFDWFFRFRNPNDMRNHTVSDIYNYPGLEGLNSDGKIIGWISKYFALLFIRQFTMLLHSVNPITKPILPSTQRDKKLWLNYIDYFEMLVSNILNNNELLENVGLGFINAHWFEENGNIRPIRFLKELKKDLQESFDLALVSQELSPSKLKSYFNTTRDILHHTFDEYDFLANQTISGKEFKNYYPIIQSQLFEKAAFADNQEVYYADFDTYHAETISDYFKKFVPDTFYLNKSEYYLVNGDEIFQSLDRLQIDEKEHLLIWFGNNLDYYLQINNIVLNNLRYKNIDVVNLKYDTVLTNNSFFVLRKIDIPYLYFSEINISEQHKYGLKCIDEKYKIYANIIDLNKNEDIKNEIVKSYSKGDISKSVLSVIKYNAKLIWRKDIKCVQIQAYLKYLQKDLPNSLDDIKKF